MPSFAETGSTVILQTNSMGQPSTQPFQVTATFSEPVIDFGPTKIHVTNGTVMSVTGSDCQPVYTILIQPISSGEVDVLIPANAATSLSTGAPSQASSLLKVKSLNPAVPPASNFNLKQWTLNTPLPLGAIHNAISIGQTTLNGVPGKNNGYSNPPYFFTDQNGAMNFFAPLNGGTTPGSSFARCELYEILPGASPTWKLNTFKSNTLSASLLVKDVTPVEKRIVIGQIHDKGNTDSFGHSASNSPLLKLYYDANALDPNNNLCNGCVYAQIRKTPAQSKFLMIVNLINNIPLNTIFTYQLKLLNNGALTVTANQASTLIQLNTSNNNTLGWGAQQLYFKAGVYNLENGGSNTLGGATSFYALQVSHV